MDSTNYEFSYKLLKKVNGFPVCFWEASIKDKTTNVIYVTQFQGNNNQPDDSVVFQMFLNKEYFKQNFFIDAEIISDLVPAETSNQNNTVVNPA
jgi:hypothetical protein